MGELKEKYNQYFNYDISLTPAFPRVMLLETTNCCNHSCVFCSHSKMTRPKGFMKEDLAYRILEEAYKEGTREVGFYMLGEPLLDKNLEKYIKYAKDLGYSYIFFTTNGVLLDEDRMISIIESGIDSIKFSFNGGNKDHYLFSHGVDSYEQVKENIIRLSNYRKEHCCNFKIFISSVLTKYTQTDDKEINREFFSYVDDISIQKCHKQGGSNKEVADTLAMEDTIQTGSVRNGICFYPFNRLHVTYEGYLALCCMDVQNYLVIENLNNISLKDAWNSVKFQQIRQRHLDKNLEGTLCHNCLNNTSTNVQPILEEYAYPCYQNSKKNLEMIQSRIDSLLSSKPIE